MGGRSDLQLASFDPFNLCPGKRFNPIRAIVWRPPYKHCNYANYIKLQILCNCVLVGCQEAEKRCDNVEDFLRFESAWK